MREVVGPLVAALTAGRPVAFCQVVATRGSTPQSAGAMLLLEPDGTQVGTLGGGCVEAEVKRKAAGLIGREGADLFRFVLDHDPAWADGLICGGRMTILAECPRGPAALAYYQTYLERIEAGQGWTEAIALDPARAGVQAAGDRFLFDPAGQPIAALPEAIAPSPGVGSGLGPLVGRPRPAESNGWAYLPTAPTVRLVIVGAGHIGQAVAAVAGRVGFAVTVVDDRAEYVTPARFPTARRLVGPIRAVLDHLEITPATYALIVTRGHGHDGEALGILAPTAAGYVGMIGSRRKVKQICDDLLDAGIAAADLARVAAPVGLEIGSETVDEIAISIVAELIARRNLGADSLRDLRATTGRRRV